MADVPTAPLLVTSGVTLQYKTTEKLVTATYRVDFAVDRSDRYVLLGPSGCGKSTLLKAVGGYIKPTEGRITLGGREIAKPGPDRVMVFQEFDQLLPWKTVRENVVFALTVSGTLIGRAAQERARHYIAKVGLEKFGDSYPHTLSGGMKARVAIARGMAMEPEILLMDEPFSRLDAQTRSAMHRELLRIQALRQMTILFVTHEIEEAVVLADHIVVMAPRPGRIRTEVPVTIPQPRIGAAATAALVNELRASLGETEPALETQ
jgi:NitT/TauT family transport system ATP-binding protein